MNNPSACVIGDLSLVRALGRRHLPVALATHDLHSSAARSRYCRTVVPIPSFVDRPDDAISALVDWAKTLPEQPVLFYEGDHDLLAISRARDLLRPFFRFVLPDRELVEDLVDKVRFAAFAERLSLPTPRTYTLQAALGEFDTFPCVIKPAMRSHWFDSRIVMEAIGTNQKALRLESRGELRRILPLLLQHETSFVLQEAIEGDEDRVLSYHAYVRPGGEIVAEYTGRKVRTVPRRYGLSTYLEITDDPEVKAIGRDVVSRIGFFGVLKMDFKKDTRDRIHLLEINPRFSLWHHAATVAGACIPELVYRDCVKPGSARSPRSVRPGVRWMNTREDLRAYRERRSDGTLSLRDWVAQVLTADVNEDLCLIDPLPGFWVLAGVAGRRLRRARARSRLLQHEVHTT